MSRFEYRVSYRRINSEYLQKKIFRQRPAADRYVVSTCSKTELDPLAEIFIDEREVGQWARIWTGGHGVV